MSPGTVSAKVVAERASYVRRMIASLRALPLESEAHFLSDSRTPAAADSYLRRSIEALLDLGRHILAKAFARAAPEYKVIATELGDAGVLPTEQVVMLVEMAGYRSRLVHFYDEVTAEEIYDICAHHLTDIESVLASLESWLRANPGRIDHSL